MLWAEVARSAVESASVADPSHAGVTAGWLYAIGALISAASAAITAAIIKVIPVITAAREKRMQASTRDRQQRLEGDVAYEEKTDQIRRDAYDHVANEFRDLLQRQAKELQDTRMWAKEQDDRHESTIATFRGTTADLYQQVSNLTQLHADCQVKNQKLLSRVTILESRLEAMQVSEGEARIPTRAQAVVVADADGVIREWPPAATTLFHYRRRDAVGKNVSILVPPEHLASHLKMMAEVVSTGRPVRRGPYFFNAVTSGGVRIPVEMVLSQWDDGGEKMFSATIRQIAFLPDETPTGALAASRQAAVKVARELTESAGVGQFTATPTPGGGSDVHIPPGSVAEAGPGSSLTDQGDIHLPAGGAASVNTPTMSINVSSGGAKDAPKSPEEPPKPEEK